MSNQIEDKVAYLIVSTKENGYEDILLDPNGVLCIFCRREKGNQDLIISGHAVSICSECFVYLNTTYVKQSVCGQN